MARTPGILFTAFEPSGDEHAAPVIARIRSQSPDTPIWALGGPRMSQAGAQLLEMTTGHAAMLVGAASQVVEYKRRLNRLRQWLGDHDIAVLVPVDSPAANWSFCALFRKEKPRGRIVHLVAPQLWAWGAWRIGKLRRLTDLVLCLLPFEPAWFSARGVPAVFVGHPAFDPEAATVFIMDTRLDLPVDGPKLALLPGSRAGEIKANWPTMLEIFRQLRGEMPGLSATVAAVHDRAEAQVRALTGPRKSWPEGLHVVTGRTPEVLDWCQAALVVSGTATLHVAVARKPMVVMYNISWINWQIGGRWLLKTRTFALPNLLSEDLGIGRVAPEFVPHFRQVEPVLHAVRGLLTDPATGQAQRDGFARIAERFAGHPYAELAAGRILGLMNEK